MSASQAWAAASLALDMFPGDETFSTVSRLIQRDQIKEAKDLVKKEARSASDTERKALLEGILHQLD